MRSDGTGYRVIVPLGGTLHRADQAEFSPDGKSIAFRGGDTFPYHIYVVTGFDGSAQPQVRQLTEGQYQDNWPHFSPDDTKVMFTRATDPGRNLTIGDVWIRDLQTGEEARLTNTGDGSGHGVGWCPFDNRIYFSRSLDGTVQDSMVRMAPDGSSEECLATIVPIGRITWANTGAWIGSTHALPGEQVKVPIGMADAEELAEAITDINFGDMAALGASRGRTVSHWNMTDPALNGDVLSLHTFAPDPLSQHVSGPAHLFDMWLGVPAAAAPDEQRVLSFSNLYLANKLGQPLPRLALSGSVRTIPFAALRLEIGSPGPQDEPFMRRLRVSALDREGMVMRSCNLTVGLAYQETIWDRALDLQQTTVQPVSPAQVTLENGEWSGAVILPGTPKPGSRLFVFWGDIADYSPSLVPQQ